MAADRHTHTDTQTRVTTKHFASSTTHAKCNKIAKTRKQLLISREVGWLGFNGAAFNTN